MSSQLNIYVLHGQALRTTQSLAAKRCFILCHHCAKLSIADLFCDKSHDLRSHVLNCWECKEIGRNPFGLKSHNLVKYLSQLWLRSRKYGFHLSYLQPQPEHLGHKDTSYVSHRNHGSKEVFITRKSQSQKTARCKQTDILLTSF